MWYTQEPYLGGESKSKRIIIIEEGSPQGAMGLSRTLSSLALGRKAPRMFAFEGQQHFLSGEPEGCQK